MKPYVIPDDQEPGDVIVHSYEDTADGGARLVGMEVLRKGEVIATHVVYLGPPKYPYAGVDNPAETEPRS